MSGSPPRKVQRLPNVADDAGPAHGSEYFPPCIFLLDHLGIPAADLAGSGNVQVSKKFLRTLIGELVKSLRFDQQWYAKTYPDVESARLAGDVESLDEHFIESGYFEGRLPAELPFDPQWYRMHYRDIEENSPESDPESMRNHFLAKGYFEGRAGTAEMLIDVERWRALASR